MTAPAGYYDTSYPPSLWETPPVTTGAARTAGDPGEAASRSLTVSSGTPGAYDPPLTPAERPTSLTDLREQALPVDEAPWSAGEYVPLGSNGRHAHWDGEDWQSGDAPAATTATEDADQP